MRYGFVGSRRRTDRQAVIDAVNGLPAGSVVVSGGAAGPDTWAVDAAKARGLETSVLLPDLDGVSSRHDATKRYYARNQRIADDSDAIVAFVAPDRKGGTEDTIRRALKRGIPGASAPAICTERQSGRRECPQATGTTERKNWGPNNSRMASLKSAAIPTAKFASVGLHFSALNAARSRSLVSARHALHRM